jgi:hypothetical protein
MREPRVVEPGSASIRRQMGIEQDCRRMFRPYTLEEAREAAALIAADDAMRGEYGAIVELLSVGIPLDLMPDHLAPSIAALARSARISRRRVEHGRLLWECLEPSLRADLVHRAVRIILVLRASKAG